MPRAPKFLVAFALSVMTAACAVDSPDTSEAHADVAPLAAEPAAGEPSIAIPQYPYWRRFYFVATRDERRCQWPACGGFFVRAVNATTTPCWDGVSAPECYVASLDFAGSALPLATQDKLIKAIASQPEVTKTSVVLRGTIGPSQETGYADLKIDAAWLGGTGDPGAPGHSTRYYQIVDDAPNLVIRRLGVNEPDHAVSAFQAPPVGSIITGFRDEELFDIDARFPRVR